MGITISYRGQLADLARIENFEDRLVDCALEIGAQVQIWRTWADDNPARMVRGVILGLAPGLESTSLLVSPEGWLIGLIDIQDAEEGRLKEPPWCFTKTQFGPIEGHVALVELLAALKREFLPDLEVSDEGGFWETRDLDELVRKHSLMKQAIDGLADGLRRYGLSHEAAEDPSILLRHIERVAELVHRNLRRPPEDPPALREHPPFHELVAEEVEEGAGFREADDDSFATEKQERHPLLQKAMDLLERFDSLFHDEGPGVAPLLGPFYQGAGDALGGLAQALSARDHDAYDYGLRIVQLKRALRGTAFARGALFPLRSAMSAEQSEELFGTLKQMETEILSELGNVRSEYRGEDS